jgi:hypothetical protein
LPIISFKKAQLSLKRTRPRAIWPVAICAVVLVGCIAGFVIAGKKAPPTQRQSLQQVQIDDLVRQVSTLTRSDLIVFPDGRVWYVRGIHGGNMEVVGWIGDNAKSEDIYSFVLANNDFKIVRQGDSMWAKNRDGYFKQ